MLVRLKATRSTVAPERWTPSWLEGSQDHEPGIAAAREEQRRDPPLTAMPADPFFQAATGFRQYKAPSQREAVRAVALSASGATVIVSLPTGNRQERCRLRARRAGRAARFGHRDRRRAHDRVGT